MKSVDRHLADILAAVRPLAPLEIDLDHALGTVLAEDVTAPVPLPPFDNSAMDGYAVRAEDVASAPVTLPVVDDIALSNFPKITSFKFDDKKYLQQTEYNCVNKRK